jgi:hypothetical protein
MVGPDLHPQLLSTVKFQQAACANLHQLSMQQDGPGQGGPFASNIFRIRTS